jgi:hypothetical protein
MKKKSYKAIGTVPISNPKIVETQKPITHTHIIYIYDLVQTLLKKN